MRTHFVAFLLLFLNGLFGTIGFCADEKTGAVPEIRTNWKKVTGPVKTALTMQLWPHPLFLRDSPLHDRLFQAIADLGADYQRLQVWFSFPRLAVAELDPPANGKTSWDFTYLDPLMIDFMKAVASRPVQINLSTIPQWMFKTDEPVSYPADPHERKGKYGGGTELRDPSLKEVRDYFVRLFQWYTQGGFVDEYGKEWNSGHRFKFANWEVLNEPDLEHRMSPQLYTRVYDEVVGELKKIDRQMTYCGLSLSDPGLEPEYLEYFLDSRNHKPGIPLDMISYHFYAMPDFDETPEVQEHTAFAQVDGFSMAVRYMDNIRKRLSPSTKTNINEVGTFVPDQSSKQHHIPATHWNLSAAMFGHFYIQMVRLGIDMIALAELNNYPGLPTDVTLTDWNTGQPNARYWALKMMIDEIHPGDQLVESAFEPEPPSGPFGLHAFNVQAFVSAQGERKLLIVNKRNRPLELRIADGRGAQVVYVDAATGSHPAERRKLDTDTLKLQGYAVAVVKLAAKGV